MQTQRCCLCGQRIALSTTHCPTHLVSKMSDDEDDNGNNDDDDGGNDDDDGGGGDACGDYDVLTEVALAPITTPVTSYFNFFLVFIKTT